MILNQPTTKYNKPLICEECGEKFRYVTNLVKHKAEEHKAGIKEQWLLRIGERQIRKYGKEENFYRRRQILLDSIDVQIEKLKETKKLIRKEKWLGDLV